MTLRTSASFALLVLMFAAPARSQESTTPPSAAFSARGSVSSEGALSPAGASASPSSLTARVFWKRKNVRAREGTVIVAVRDERGHLLDGATVGVEDAVIEEATRVAPGEQHLRVKWSGDIRELRFKITLGRLRADLPPLPLFEPDPIERETGGAECAVAPGFGFVNDGLSQRGVRVAVACGYRFAVREAALAIAAEIGIEGYPAVDLVAPDGSGYEISQTNTIFAVPISYRFLPHTRPVVPYFSIIPQLLVQSAEHTDISDGFSAPAFPVRSKTTPLLGLAGKVGVQIALGPGGFFVELGYRGAARKNRRSVDVANASGVLFDLGYRFQF